MRKKIVLITYSLLLLLPIGPLWAQDSPVTTTESISPIETLITELSLEADTAKESDLSGEQKWGVWWSHVLSTVPDADDPWQTLATANQKALDLINSSEDLSAELKAKLLGIHQITDKKLNDAIALTKSAEEVQAVIEKAKQSASKHPLKEFNATHHSLIGGIGGGALSLGGKLTGGNPLGDVTSLGGLNPIAALSSSLDNTTTVIDHYPEKVRKETEVLLANDATKQALDSVERFSHSSIMFAEVSETLPDEIRQTLEELADDQPQFQGTIKEINTLTATAGSTTEELNHLTQSVDQVLKSVTELAAMFPPDPDAPTPPPGRPFDITEYTTSLQELNVTLKETQTILGQVDGLVATERVDELLSNTTRETNEVVSKIKSSIISILVVFFLLASLWVVVFYYVKRKVWVPKS